MANELCAQQPASNWRKRPKDFFDKINAGTTMVPAFLAPQKEFESPTFRLGGGRSILLSYWGMCDTF